MRHHLPGPDVQNDDVDYSVKSHPAREIPTPRNHTRGSALSKPRATGACAAPGRRAVLARPPITENPGQSLSPQGFHGIRPSRQELDALSCAINWAPYGGPPADELLVRFGMYRDRFFTLVTEAIDQYLGCSTEMDRLTRHLPKSWGPDEMKAYLFDADVTDGLT